MAELGDVRKIYRDAEAVGNFTVSISKAMTIA
jgi:hypothetical protein